MPDYEDDLMDESAPFAGFHDGNWEPDFEPDIVHVKAGSHIIAAPFKWIDPEYIPPRKWLYGRHLIRGRVSLDVAAGGVGKTSLKIGEAIAMAAGIDLYNKALPEGPLRVWFYNLEDDLDELQRRIAATCQHFNIKPEQLGDRLFVNSGLDQSFTIASGSRDGITIHAPVVEDVLQQIAANKIDVMIVDPFVSSHSVSENDNMAIDAVVKKGYVRIAYEGNVAMNIVHHIRKTNGEEADIDSARGAVSLVGAARSAVVYNRMSESEAQKAGVDPEKRAFHFKVQNGKSNLAPNGERADWYRMNNVDLANGDKVGVASQWIWPAPSDIVSAEVKFEALRAIREGQWSASVQSPKWVGNVIGECMALDPDDPDDAVTIKSVIKSWLRDKVICRVEREDSYRKTRVFIEAAP